MSDQYDIVVIGGGSGGYVAAIRAAQLGFKTACIDKRDTLGGTCLNVGCIPSKALLNASHKYDEFSNSLQHYGIQSSKPTLDLGKLMESKTSIVQDLTKGIDFLLRKNKVDRLKGAASFKDAGTINLEGDKNVHSKHFIIATGSESSPLPNIPVDEKTILSSTGALALTTVPNHLVVIGGGYIGLEMASVWKRLGSKVTVIEFLDRIVPTMDHEISQNVFKILQSQGIEFKLSTKVIQHQKTPQGLTLFLETSTGEKKENLGCDVALLSIGRRPYTEGLALDTVGVEVDEKGFIKTDASFATNVPGLYAIGDVIKGPMLAHKAEKDGVACVELIAGQKPHVDYTLVPSVMYTHPEVASVGQGEETLQANNIPYKVGKFPLSANSRARANMESQGFIKVLSHKETDEILGVHMIAADAGTMIAEAALALSYKASSEDVARTCHAHPTLSEAFKEAALAVDKMAIHI